MKNSIKKGLEAELRYCKAQLKGPKPLQHWTIRKNEIEQELKKGTKNVKTAKTRQR